MPYGMPKAISRTRCARSAAGHPTISRLPSREAGPGMAGAAGLPDRATFRARLLPPFELDRAVVGAHAQERHPQQVLRHLPRLQHRDADLPAQRADREREHILR